MGYISTVFNNYKSAACIERFHGRVAEIGPGDSAGVGLRFLADGCGHVDLVDRFFSPRDQQQQAIINQAIVQQFPQLKALQRNGEYQETSFNGLSRHYGSSAAAEKFFSTNKGYDYIVSCAVLEHVTQPLTVLSRGAAALNPGGMMIHQVDCRDHGQFSDHFDELKFLQLPEFLYAPLKWGGGPNRVRLSSYMSVMQQEALNFNVYVTSLAGIAEPLPKWTPMNQIPQQSLEISRQYVSSVRRRLARPFCDMHDDDLMVTSFMMVASKPAIA